MSASNQRERNDRRRLDGGQSFIMALLWSLAIWLAFFCALKLTLLS